MGGKHEIRIATHRRRNCKWEKTRTADPPPYCPPRRGPPQLGKCGRAAQGRSTPAGRLVGAQWAKTMKIREIRICDPSQALASD